MAARTAGVTRARFSTRPVLAAGAAMANVERRVRRVKVLVVGKSMVVVVVVVGMGVCGKGVG